MKIPRKPYYLLPFLLLILLSNTLGAQLDTIPKNNDKAFSITSKILGEQRSIWIHLPAKYDQTTQTYPTLYLLDGDGHFKYVSELVDYLSGYDRNRIPEMIVVAIVNVDRTRDFTPIHSLIFDGKKDSARMSSTGGGIKFLSFIQNELVPFIDTHYRTQPYRVLAAHSLAGLFALYAKELNPELFKSEILMSPAIYGGNARVLDDFKPFLKSNKELSGKFFISIGNEQTNSVDTIAKFLKQFGSQKIDWRFRKYKEENHFSVTYKSMYDGLTYIFRNWYFDNYGKAMWSWKEIQTHFTNLSVEFGYKISPAEDFVNNAGYKQLQSGKIDAAIEIFRENIKNYPGSWNAYDSMGEAYMAKGDKRQAIENYEKSVLLNPSNEDGRITLQKLKKEK